MVKLNRLKGNLHEVVVNGLSIYFSYDTPVAFKVDEELLTSDNIWSQTTGSHLNLIKERNEVKTRRANNNVFKIQLKKAIENL